MTKGVHVTTWVGLLLCLTAPLSQAADSEAPSAQQARQGKIKGTAGVSSVSGASGGGLIPWATLSSYAAEEQRGITAFKTRLGLPDYELDVQGGTITLDNRLELAYGRQAFTIKAAGVTITQDKLSARLRVAGDLLYGDIPQVTLTAERGSLRDKGIARAVGAQHTAGTDWLASFAKVWIDGIAARTTLLNVNVRYGDSNQFGILGYGGDVSGGKFAVESSVAVFLNRDWAIGAEFRQKNDQLSALRENHARDVFVAWFPNKYLSVTTAWVDLGEVAGRSRQRGLYLSLQVTP